ncbi:MAG TPA: YeeE/YedE thiosulfate transporter family protein [Candidatus Acidoferrales bacterium]|nr:YeeE/YedE thiosulfate transporter family protein [Candidatus Acidoferrales bacterium]
MDITAVSRALAGGLLIGSAASGLLLLNGRLAGISNIVAGLISPRPGETDWRLAFLIGLLAGGATLLFAYPSAFPETSSRPLGLLAVAGLLVGVGTRLGNGCTSGHGVCGLARRSPRSLSATLVFMTTGAIAVYVVNHLLPWSAR